MNKFAKQLAKSNKSIKDDRAIALAKKATFAQEEILRDFEVQEIELEEKLETLQDLSPENSLSLLPTKGTFDAKEWVKQVHTVKMELEDLKINIKVAKETLKEWFTEEDDEESSK